MLTSIRWRLVMGAMVLTLLTVSVVGIVALLLVQRYVAQQERAYLATNAEAIAQQAASFMVPVVEPPTLQQLAQTAAFLSDVTVRIVDTAQMPLADSTFTTQLAAPATLAPPSLYFRVAPYAPVPVGEMPFTVESGVGTAASVEAMMEPARVPGSAPAIVPASPPEIVGIDEANVIVVQKAPGFWGDRLLFRSSVDAQPMSTTAPVPLPIGRQVTTIHTQEAVAAQPVVTEEPVKVGILGRLWTMLNGQIWNYEATPIAPAAMSQLAFSPTALVQSGKAVTAPIQANGAVVGFVEVERAINVTNEPLQAIRRALGIAAGVSALLAIGVGLVMSRSLTAPIQNLAQAAAAMSSGDLTARAPVAGRDELAALARQFNQMADSLHNTFVELAAERDTLRRFVADASHELRTPITALRTFNELLQGPANGDAAAQREFLAESHAQIARLEWITRNLLDLSRWDGGMATLALAEMEVGEIVAAAVTPFRNVAQERGVALTVLLPELPVMAMVDGPRLGMAVGNLLDNALKFTPNGGCVEVGVAQEDRGVKIWVKDTGMGIGPDDLPHIFARFYRSPRATQPGSGLGLAIVERIVHAHGMTVAVESEEGVGSEFVLRMV